MRNENGWVGHYIYEIVNIKEWENGRTLQIGFQDYDPATQRPKWRHSVLFEEKANPEYFEYCLKRFAKGESEYEKPFTPKPF